MTNVNTNQANIGLSTQLEQQVLSELTPAGQSINALLDRFQHALTRLEKTSGTVDAGAVNDLKICYFATRQMLSGFTQIGGGGMSSYGSEPIGTTGSAQNWQSSSTQPGTTTEGVNKSGELGG